MTETSPGSFMSYTDDPVEKRLCTVGKILPHTKAKIVDGKGELVQIGTRGELLVSGFQLQKGYWRNPKQTAEAMERDDDGCLWMRTGDEAVFDDEGYCSITGRIKDIIIRGRYSWQGKLLLTHPMQEARTYFLSRSKRSLVNTDLSSSPASLVYLTTSTAKWSQHSCSIERQSHVRPVKF